MWSCKWDTIIPYPRNLLATWWERTEQCHFNEKERRMCLMKHVRERWSYMSECVRDPVGVCVSVFFYQAGKWKQIGLSVRRRCLITRKGRTHLHAIVHLSLGDSQVENTHTRSRPQVVRKSAMSAGWKLNQTLNDRLTAGFQGLSP